MFKTILFVLSLIVLLPIAYGFCSANNSSIAKYEEIKDLRNHPEILLIDVRTQKEVDDYGLIPTRIHIPMYALRDILSLTANKERFLQKYSRKFPKPEDQLIFTCLLGVRARKAMEIACSLGYEKSRFYEGSWYEWVEKEALKSNEYTAKRPKEAVKLSQNLNIKFKNQ